MSLLAVVIIAVAVVVLIALADRRRNRNDETRKIAARVDEQTAALNSRPHLPHVEVSPIDPPVEP